MTGRRTLAGSDVDGARPAARGTPPLRLFLALWPTPSVRTALAARRDAIGWPREARVVSDDRLHLTLHFIGAVPRALWPRLPGALRVPCHGIALQFQAARAWPHGLVVLPARTVSDALRELHAALGRALTGLGLPVEQRAFRPHVTLARRAAGAQLPATLPLLSWRSGSYALVNSDPVAGYQVLARFDPRGVTLPATRRTATERSRPAPAPRAR